MTRSKHFVMLKAFQALFITILQYFQTLGKFGMMFYNSIIALPFAAAIFLVSGDYDSVSGIGQDVLEYTVYYIHYTVYCSIGQYVIEYTV